MSSTRKLRRTSTTPGRYGTLEVQLGSVVDVPRGVASELVATGDWEFVPADESTTSAPGSDPAPATTSRRRKSSDDLS